VDVLKEISSVNSPCVPHFDCESQMTRSLDFTILAITGDLYKPNYSTYFNRLFQVAKCFPSNI